MCDSVADNLVGNHNTLRFIISLLGLFDDGWRLGDFLSKDVVLEEIRKEHCRLMRDETFRWDRENLYETISAREC